MYDVEDLDVRLRRNDLAIAIQALLAVSRFSQHHNRHVFSQQLIECGGRQRY